MNKIVNVMETWPESIYSHHGYTMMPCYDDIDAEEREIYTTRQDYLDVEYIRSDLVKVKTEEEIKDIIGVTLDDRLEAFDVVDSALVNSIFDALKNAGLHCK